MPKDLLTKQEFEIRWEEFTDFQAHTAETFKRIEIKFVEIDRRFDIIEKRLDIIEKRLDVIEKRLDDLTIEIKRQNTWMEKLWQEQHAFNHMVFGKLQALELAIR